MFSNLKIENFRSLREVTLDNLAQLNIIAGVNGAGKTSILESIFLLSGGAKADCVVTLGGLRSGSPSRNIREIELSSIYSEGPSRRVTISGKRHDTLGSKASKLRKVEFSPTFGQSENVSVSDQVNTIAGVKALFTEGKLRLKSHWQLLPAQNSSQSIRGTVPLGTVLRLDADFMIDNFIPKNNPLILAQYVLPTPLGPMMSYNTLVSLVKAKRTKEVVRVLSLIEPAITEVVPISERGVPKIYIDLGRPGELLPVSVLGSGFQKLLDIAIAFQGTSRGVVLIDEVEAGFHYSKYDSVIDFIYQSAVASNSQVFLTTHSKEMLGCISKWLERRRKTDAIEPSVAFCRIWRDKADRRGSTYLDADEFLAAERSGVEIR
jgi:hypothetical protein